MASGFLVSGFLADEDESLEEVDDELLDDSELALELDELELLDDELLDEPERLSFL